MFEAVILLALLGLIIWFIIAREAQSPVRRNPFIELSAELRPPARKSGKGRLS